MYERSDGWITTLASPSFRAAREVGGSQDGRRDGLKPGPLREDFDTGASRTRPTHRSQDGERKSPFDDSAQEPQPSDQDFGPLLGNNADNDGRVTD